MLFRLIILLTLVPIIELALLLQLTNRFSWQITLLIILVTGVVGGCLARREGLKVLRRVSDDLSTGKMPATAIVDGLLILLAGGLLVTPGFLTDLVGFALLIPPIRRAMRRRLINYFQSRVVHYHDDGSGHEEPFIDIEAVRSEEAPKNEKEVNVEANNVNAGKDALKADSSSELS